MVAIAAASYQDALSSGVSQSEAWNASSVDWITAAKASAAPDVPCMSMRVPCMLQVTMHGILCNMHVSGAPF